MSSLKAFPGRNCAADLFRKIDNFLLDRLHFRDSDQCLRDNHRDPHDTEELVATSFASVAQWKITRRNLYVRPAD